MCDPVTMATVLSTAVSAYSAYRAGQDKKAVAEYNTRVSENEAQETRNRATEAENAQRLKTARLLSKQQAQLGAAGIDLTTGSALQLQEDTISLGEADALRIRKTGESQFSALMSESELETAKGEMAETQGFLDAGTSLLSGAGKFLGTGVADKWFTENSAANINPFVTKGNPLGLTAGQGL